MSPNETYKVTSESFVFLVPASGDVLTNFPSATLSLLTSFWTSLTLRLASCNFLIASLTVNPETSGTTTSLLLLNNNKIPAITVTVKTKPVNIAAKIIKILLSFL